MDRNQIKKLGFRATGARIRILEILEENDHRHLSAEDIFRELNLSGRSVAMATIYRVLSQFEEAGILVRSNFHKQGAVYELISEAHHDHMFCMETGEIIEFSDSIIEKRQIEICNQRGFELVEHKMILFIKKPFPRD